MPTTCAAWARSCSRSSTPRARRPGRRRSSPSRKNGHVRRRLCGCGTTATASSPGRSCCPRRRPRCSAKPSTRWPHRSTSVPSTARAPMTTPLRRRTGWGWRSSSTSSGTRCTCSPPRAAWPPPSWSPWMRRCSPRVPRRRARPRPGFGSHRASCSAGPARRAWSRRCWTPAGTSSTSDAPGGRTRRRSGSRSSWSRRPVSTRPVTSPGRSATSTTPGPGRRVGPRTPPTPSS
jgi:hypothetical protein